MPRTQGIACARDRLELGGDPGPAQAAAGWREDRTGRVYPGDGVALGIPGTGTGLKQEARTERVQSRFEVLAWSGAGMLVLLAIALVLHTVLLSPSGIIVLQDQRAPWIMVDGPITAQLQQWGRVDAPVTRFFASFDAADPGPRARLILRSFGDAKVFLNDTMVPEPDREAVNWKRFRELEVAHLLRRGGNAIRVEVANRHGPALLSLRLEGIGTPFATGPHWIGALEGGAMRGTLLATDALRYPDSYASEHPFRALASIVIALGVLLLLAALAFLVPPEQRDSLARWPALPRAALLVSILAWIALLLANFRGIDLVTGFDAINHLEYLELMRRDGRIPLAAEHWSAYQPPLFYLASAALEELAAWLGRAELDGFALKLLPFLAGLGNVWLAGALARRLLPEDRVAWAHATLFAAVLPVNLYTAAYYSNEGLHAFLAGSALVVGVGILLEEEVSPSRAALLSLLLGLALLTKFTVLLLAGPLLLVLGVKVLKRHARPGAVLVRGAALLLPALAVSGWFYARNLAEFGRPLVGNWDLPSPDRIWWSAPGFHTPQYYLRFGEVLVRPFYSGFVSFWDSIYSTLWGDGFVAGRAGVRVRHPAWNYQLMAAGYVLALPATALLGLGFLRSVLAALREREAERRAAFGLLLLVCATMGFALFYVTLVLPYHGQARASYLLAIAPALALFFALGFTSVDRWLARRGWTAGRVFLFAWWGALLGVFYLSFAG